MFYSVNSFERSYISSEQCFCEKGSEKHYSGENASKGCELKREKFAVVDGDWRQRVLTGAILAK